MTDKEKELIDDKFSLLFDVLSEIACITPNKINNKIQKILDKFNEKWCK